MNWVKIWILVLTACSSACTAQVRDTPLPNKYEPRKSIYIVSHGWHAGIVLQSADVPDNAWPVSTDFPNAQYLEVGWGDKDYYQTPNPHIGLILKAALLPSASVLHIAGFNGDLPAYFPFSEIVRIELPAAGLEHLSYAISSSFFRDEAGNTTLLNPGLYGNSHFYLSRESYHLFNTCNVWAARALRTAGLPITPVHAISVESLMSQVRKLGTVVQARADPAE